MPPALPRGREPAINLPGFIIGLIACFAAIQVVRSVLSDEADLQLLLETAFFPAAWSLGAGSASPADILEAVRRSGADPELQGLRSALARYLAGQGGPTPWSWLSYGFLHGSWLHLGLNCLWLAAFGAPVVVRSGLARSVALTVATAAGGAAAHWFSDPLGVQPMIGASAIVSGFMAAAATFVFTDKRAAGGGAATWSFLGDRTVLLFLALWFAINLLSGVLAEPLGLTEGAIAWEAHVGGLLVGLALFPLLDPVRRARALP